MNRKHFAIKLAVMALAGMMVASPAWAEKKGKATAENGPSARETADFLLGLLETCHGEKLIHGEKLSIESHFAHQITVGGEIFASDNSTAGGSSWSYHVGTKISQLDPESVRATSMGFVHIDCNPSFPNCVKGDSAKGQQYLEMAYCDSAQADRAAKALKHLIEISGGKKSLF